MLRKRTQFYKSLLVLTDILFVSVAWIVSYFLRFYVELVPVYHDIPPIQDYLFFLPVILFLWLVLLGPLRLSEIGLSASTSKEHWKLFKASTVIFLLLIVLTFFTRQELSRVAVLFFWVTSIAALSVGRFLFSCFFQYLRRKGYTVSNALIVGSGELPHTIAERLSRNSIYGTNVVGFVTEDAGGQMSQTSGVPVLGGYQDTEHIIKQYDVDLVIIGLAIERYDRLEEVLKNIGAETVDIKIVPDMQRFTTLRSEIEELNGLPFITLQGSPLHGWNMVLKRSIDLLVSLIALVILSPVMMVTALLVRLSSPGPVLYRQERAGLNGERFTILKFRTMKVDAEEGGVVWPTSSDDPRCTPIGLYLRKTRLDELPQLVNVLKGDMGLVGPRPERPVFIEEFRHTIPQYMLRSKVLAGITGLAQINEWYEYMPLEKRIEYDLYYIKNWSLGLDLTIFFLTFWRALFHPRRKKEPASGKGDTK